MKACDCTADSSFWRCRRIRRGHLICSAGARCRAAVGDNWRSEPARLLRKEDGSRRLQAACARGFAVDISIRAAMEMRRTEQL